MTNLTGSMHLPDTILEYFLLFFLLVDLPIITVQICGKLLTTR